MAWPSSGEPRSTMLALVVVRELDVLDRTERLERAVAGFRLAVRDSCPDEVPHSDDDEEDSEESEWLFQHGHDDPFGGDGLVTDCTNLS